MGNNRPGHPNHKKLSDMKNYIFIDSRLTMWYVDLTNVDRNREKVDIISVDRLGRSIREIECVFLLYLLKSIINLC